MINKVLMCLLLGVVVVGCNTVNGIGKDLEKAGQAVQKTTKGKE